jgi:HPt (histidine-containing phosphotransfer) domain-containing protein
MEPPVIDKQAFEKVRQTLTHDFVRILGYFIEDGQKSVDRIVGGMRSRDAHALVIPAHTLKNEARQFAALPLADLADEIEVGARRVVEARGDIIDLMLPVARLQPLWRQTLDVLEVETNPLRSRPARPVFGRAAANQSFGQI